MYATNLSALYIKVNFRPYARDEKRLREQSVYLFPGFEVYIVFDSTTAV